MAKDNKGVFGLAAEQPCNNWLIEMAQARAGNEGIPFNDALAQIRKENPQLVEAARLEVTGGGDSNYGPNFLHLMRRALEIAKAKGLGTEEALERASFENPDVAKKARAERGGSLYAGEFQPAPGIGDTGVLMSEGVDAALDPSAHLTMLANERCREKSISYVQALTEVGLEHPALVRASREQTTGRKLY